MWFLQCPSPCWVNMELKQRTSINPAVWVHECVFKWCNSVLMKDLTTWDKRLQHFNPEPYSTQILDIIAETDMDIRTHCTGWRTVEKRFILCLGMQEVSNPLTFQGGVQGMKYSKWRRRRHNLRFEQVSGRGGGCFRWCKFLDLQQSDGLRSLQEVQPRSLAFQDLSNQRKKIKVKIPRISVILQWLY